MASHQRQLRQERRTQRRATNDNVPGKPRNKKEKSGFGGFEIPAYKRGMTFEPMTDKQAKLASVVLANTLTFATGCAGTGKTHCPVALGVIALLKGEVEKLILTKPGAEVDEELGTEPGDAQDKIKTRVRSMLNILDRILGESHVDNKVREKQIVFEPLGSVTGLTFDNAYVIIDEAQLSTPAQMKSLITRVGNNTKMIICGDHKEQNYLEHYSGLEDALNKFANKEDVGVVDFEPDDIVRSPFCKAAILAYRENDKIDTNLEMLKISVN